MFYYLRKHIVKCFIAGIVALLPLVGLVITVAYFESQLAGMWKETGFYFFGLGLIVAMVLIYLVGLLLTNAVGRWIWGNVDGLLDHVPILGNLYQTLKQLLGYGEGPDAIFRRVVFITSRDLGGEEIGLVTNEEPQNQPGKIAVFVPSAPSPATGRLIYVEPRKVRDSTMTVNQAMKSLVAIGSLDAEKQQK